MRFAESLVEYLLREFTHEGDVVLDPFAGYGTTLAVAEAMERMAYGVECDEQRLGYARTLLRHPERLVHGDSRRLALLGLPSFDLSLTSPPYMNRSDREDPFSGYSAPGDYSRYLDDLMRIYDQVRRLMKPEARVVLEVANLKRGREVTTLAWDVAASVSRVLRFEGEVVVAWDSYGYGYDHSYCLVFSAP